MNRKTIFLAALLVLSLFSGCKTNTTQPPPAAPSPTPEVVTPTSIVTLVTTTPTPTPLPVVVTPSLIKSVPAPLSLGNILSNAEKLINNVNNKNWIKGLTDLNAIKSNLNELNPILNATPAVSVAMVDGLNNGVLNLEREFALKKMYETNVAANAITKVVLDISGGYKTIVPTDVGRMSFYCREMYLNSEKTDWQTADSNLEQCKGRYASVKVQLDVETFKNDIGHIDTLLDKLSKNVKDRNMLLTKNELSQLIDKIAVLDTDFRKQAKV